MMASKFEWALDGYVSRDEALNRMSQISGREIVCGKVYIKPWEENLSLIAPAIVLGRAENMAQK